TDAHSSSGICTPSRYALLTGRYHWRKFHDIVDSWEPTVFDPGEQTLPGLLADLGYRSACIGKWHLGWDWSAIRKPDAEQIAVDGARKTWPAEAFDWSKPIPGGPLDHGFHFYFGDDVPNFPPYAWIENDRVLIAPTVAYEPDPKPNEGAPEGRPGPMVEGWKQDEVMPALTRKAVEWIAGRNDAGPPFFLLFSWTSPHAPILPAPEWQGRTEAGPYGDFVAQSDWCAGQVLQALDERGFRENTLVIFTSDNGPERYAYDRIRNHGHRSMGPLRGLKRDIWEGGHRVPFVVRWPGIVAPGTVCDALISQIDLLATIAAIVDAKLPAGAASDSFDQSALLRGERQGARPSLVHNTYRDHYAIRRDQWLLIDAAPGAVSNVPAWFDEANGYIPDGHPAALYNLREDLSQRHNLFAAYPGLVDELRGELRRIRERGTSVSR
ncbi:MAG TPA: arylsulfatase, partial [Verrucomicrobiales bacterium]|nr:arylsulfatase [Verrucomicrobiales bacterium]